MGLEIPSSSPVLQPLPALALSPWLSPLCFSHPALRDGPIYAPFYLLLSCHQSTGIRALPATSSGNSYPKLASGRGPESTTHGVRAGEADRECPGGCWSCSHPRHSLGCPLWAACSFWFCCLLCVSLTAETGGPTTCLKELKASYNGDPSIPHLQQHSSPLLTPGRDLSVHQQMSG